MSSFLQWAGELALRAFVALLIALVPEWAPAEVRAPSDDGALTLLFVAFVAFVVMASLGIARLARKDRLSAALVALAVLALPVAATVHRGEGGPLLRAAIWLSPLVWITVAMIVSRVLVPRYFASAPAIARRMAFVAPLVLCAIGIFLGRDRLASRAAMWRAALALDPGNEPAALSVATQLQSKADDQAYGVLRACTNARPDACRCADAFATRALDRDQGGDALKTVAHALEQCGASAVRNGIRAEALITLLPAEALKAADEALAVNASEPHALYAKAMLAPSLDEQRAFAVRAIEHGRGERANMLLGVLLLRASDLDGAAAQFDAVLREHPNEPRATYNLAFIAHKRGRYREAREGYLRTLQIDPKMLDARYNLVVLTHDNGANEEAKHHLEALVAADPRYPGIPQATQMVATTAGAPSAATSASNAPAPSASAIAKGASPDAGKR